MRSNYFLVIFLSFFFCSLLSQERTKLMPWGQEEEGKFLVEEIQKKFKEYTNRYVGSEGNQKFSDFIEAEFERLVGKENCGFTAFKMPVFKPGQFYLELSDDTRIPIYSLEPNQIELSNFAQRVTSLNLVYGAQGKLEDLDGLTLEHSAVLLSMQSASRWQELVPFGAEAFLFLESEEDSTIDTDSKISDAPLSMPRFLIRKKDQVKLQAEAGKFIKEQKVKIIAERDNVWDVPSNLKNHYAYIKGKDDSRFVVISTHYDTNGFVPALSQNSSDDVNLALFFHLMQVFKEKQPDVSVMFVAFNGFYQATTGPSDFLWFAFGSDEILEQEQKFYQSREVIYSTISDFYAEYSPEKLDGMREASAKINGRNFSWKKPMIDLLRRDQNNASEQIMNLSFSMKKALEDKEHLIEESAKIVDLNEKEKQQWASIKELKQSELPDEEGLQGLQNKVIKQDIVLNVLVEEIKQLEEQYLKLSRNFAHKANAAKIKETQEAITSKFETLSETLKLRNQNQMELVSLLKDVSSLAKSDELQNHIIEYLGRYFAAVLELHKQKAIKTNSITVQKLFNGSFSEQLFIMEKAGEKRELIDSYYEPIVRKYFQDVYAQSLQYKKAAELEKQLLEQNTKIRALTMHKTDAILVPKCVMIFDLNLTYGNDRFGLFTELSIAMNTAPPVSYGRGAKGEFKEAGAFIANALNLSKNILNSTNGQLSRKNLIVDTTTTTRFNTFILRNCNSVQSEAKTVGVPAVMLVTTEDRSDKNHTTLNDYTKIQPQNLISFWNYFSTYIPMLMNESDFIKNTLRPYTSSSSSFIFNFVQQDNLAISVPETPVANVLLLFGASSTNPLSGLGSVSYHGAGYSVRRIIMSNAMGTASIRNIRQLGVYGYEAYQFDSEFKKINNAMDMLKGSKTFKNDLIGLSETFKDCTVAIFPCEKIDLYDVFDYQKMVRYNSVRVLDGVQNSKPDNISVSGIPLLGGHPWVRVGRVNGGFSIFKKPETSIKVILENKVLVNSIDATTKKHAIGIGYKRDSLDRRSIAWESFKDARNLNTYRNDVLIAKGVKDSLVRQLNQQSNESYDVAETNIKEKKYSEFFKNLYRGFGMTYASYPKVLSVMNDMIKAVVFYLALVIPFSFFIQRLMFPVTAIEKQLGINVLVFFVTFLIFRYIHPAFELTDAPLIVLIAFVQIVLALFVFNVLYNKFDARIKILQGRTSGGESAGANIISQALIIGVNNMRKRKIRTLLTCVTIILVTFTMLSFTSISTTVEPTMRRTEVSPPYTGVFYAKNSWGNISPDTFIQAFPNHSQIVRRAWFNRNSALFNIKLPPFDSIFNVSTILGLEKAEEGFLGKLPIVVGRYFSEDHAKEIILSSGMAEILKIDVNNFTEQDVQIMGEEFKLVGFFDEKRMEDFKDIRGASILPQQVIGKAPSAQDLLELDDSQNDGNNNFRATNPKMLALMPYQTVLGFGGNTVSVSLKYDSFEKLWSDTKQFTTYSKENIYLSSMDKFKTDPEAPAIRPGVFYIGGGFSTSIGGLTDLIIPLIISATIIMNTMLGTVYERKKEIEIYTAVGLNPTQIGLFFIAESLVYGIIGSVSGYLIGQSASKVIDTYHFLEGIDLNFSSLLVVYVMLFTILIVVLSTIYPAFTAVKAAQPTGNEAEKSGLKIKEDSAMQLYPFSFTEGKRFAINAYIRDYILKFADASTGSFMSKPLDMVIGEHYDESTDFTTEKAFIQKFDIALTPYDLGVTEVMELVTFYHPKVNAYMMKIVLHRISGTDSNFLRTNQPFIDELRKLLLRWRVESIAVQEKYQLQGEVLVSLCEASNEVRA